MDSKMIDFALGQIGETNPLLSLHSIQSRLLKKCCLQCLIVAFPVHINSFYEQRENSRLIY